MDAFNVIAGLITIASFVFALVIYVKDRGLRRHIESGLLILIGSMDKIAAMEESSKFKKLHMGIAAAAARDHAIALLKSFSDKEERIKTWDMGITDEEIEEKIKTRRKAHGISYGGCVVTGQHVGATSGNIVIENIKKEQKLIGYNIELNTTCDCTCKRIEVFDVPNYLEINSSLKVTANHELFCRYIGWIDAIDIRIGFELLTEDREWSIVETIKFIKEPAKAVAMSTSSENYFASGYLVHNDHK